MDQTVSCAKPTSKAALSAPPQLPVFNAWTVTSSSMVSLNVISVENLLWDACTVMEAQYAPTVNPVFT